MSETQVIAETASQELPYQIDQVNTLVEESLAVVEGRILESFDVNFTSRFVPIRFKNSEIYTISVAAQEKTSDDAIVLIHGFGAGAAMWCANYKTLSRSHNVHAFDLLGFGRSSRPNFSADPTIAELEMVEAVEDWRKSMGIEKMFVVAHAFGAYLASSYALEHPSRVRHLVLADPWGFQEKIEPAEKQLKPYPWMTFLGAVISYFNPLTSLRAAGPFGATIMKKMRPDLQHRYRCKSPDDIYKYIHMINQAAPTGETVFMSMSMSVGWAKRPMIRRFNGINENVDVTFVYGSKSFIDPGSAFDVQAERTGYVNVEIIRGAGHHVYADQSETFNRVVLDAVEGKKMENKLVDNEEGDNLFA